MMTVASGTVLGHYSILSPLGAGGMGEVWLAEDMTLKRQVALRLLPAAVATDADRLARFQREAEAVAALCPPDHRHHLLRRAGRWRAVPDDGSGRCAVGSVRDSHGATVSESGRYVGQPGADLVHASCGPTGREHERASAGCPHRLWPLRNTQP